MFKFPIFCKFDWRLGIQPFHASNQACYMVSNGIYLCLDCMSSQQWLVVRWGTTCPIELSMWAGFFHVLFKCFPYQVTFLYPLYLILQCSQPSSSATTVISAYCLSFSTSWAMKIISILCLNSFKASTLLGICQFISNHFPHDTMVDILRDGHISRTKKTGKQMVFPQYSIQAWPLVHIILTLLPLTLKGPCGWDLLNYQSKTRCGL